jgi:peptidoglycan hydrolase CwlO-like protein
MCDSTENRMHHRRGAYLSPWHFFMMGDCGPSYESKETMIKRLEAHKSHLQDQIQAIDQKIAEMQKPEEGEEV